VGQYKEADGKKWRYRLKKYFHAVSVGIVTLLKTIPIKATTAPVPF